MKKDEFEELDKLARKALKELGGKGFNQVDGTKIGQLLRINKSLFDIAYSFTEAVKLIKRIADQGEPTRIVFADKPAPDVAGLVEAVRNHIRANDAKHIGRLTEEEMEPLRIALAAHKPEVADGT